MSNETIAPDPAPEISKLVSAIRSLMIKQPNAWFCWRRVSKEYCGTEEFEAYLSGLASLPEAKRLFRTYRNTVKLSEAGLQFALRSNIRTLTEIEEVAEAVRHYASRLERIRLRVEGISKVTKVRGKFLQAVSVELVESAIPSETPVEFRPMNGAMVHGKVVGQEPDAGLLYVAFENEIFESCLPAALSIDRAYLLYQLMEQLKNLEKMPSLMEQFLGEVESIMAPVAAEDSTRVADELSRIAPPWSRFLWGPPGAGKTYALGRIVKNLIVRSPDERILIVAPSNRAVDVAVEQLVKQIQGSSLEKILAQRMILRFGYPRKQEILQIPELLGSPELDQLNLEVRRVANSIAKAEREKPGDEDIAILRTQLLAAQEEVKNAVFAHMLNCRIVATTTTLAYLSMSPVHCIKWDTVLVDEVTMVPPAMCTFLASLAGKRFLLAGDPRQLGPVYENNHGSPADDFEWMGRDIFEKSGVSRGSGINRKISLMNFRLAKIMSQRRCSTEIWSRVKHLYEGIAQRADDNLNARLASLPPCPDRSMILMDTSECGEEAKCRNMHKSWENPFTARLAIELACTIAAETATHISVAIITPYRAQTRALKKLLRQEMSAEETPLKRIAVDAGTVHQFQGSDADIVIFDLVDGPGRKGIGRLLRDDTGTRLVNVALTRAKGKFIILADKTWTSLRLNPDDNRILWNLIMECSGEERLKVVPPKDTQVDTSSIEHICHLEQALTKSLKKGSNPCIVERNYAIYDDDKNCISIADLAISEIRLAIYCDSIGWHRKGQMWQCALRHRDALSKLGWRFLVFCRQEIEINPEGCAAKVMAVKQSIEEPALSMISS
jgi:hypothetical protein